MSHFNLENLIPTSIDGTYLFIFGSVIVTYSFTRLFINWIIASNAVKLLSYLMTSFVVLNLLLGGIVLTSMFQIPLLGEVLRTLAIFGVCLALVHAIQLTFRRKKRVYK